VDWLEPWRPLEDSVRAAAMESQLVREVTAGHPLAGVRVAAIGIADHPDDILFRLMDGSGRFATVHLTWKAGSVNWPFTRVFDNEADWIARGLRTEHKEFVELQSQSDPT